jgi:hypothetical protein
MHAVFTRALFPLPNVGSRQSDAFENASLVSEPKVHDLPISPRRPPDIRFAPCKNEAWIPADYRLMKGGVQIRYLRLSSGRLSGMRRRSRATGRCEARSTMPVGRGCNFFGYGT